MSSSASSISAPSLILVTGVSGYIASHVALQLLEGGFKVRGTVRDTNSTKSNQLKSLFGDYATKGSFQLVAAADLQQANVFDEAVKDVDGIAHIASPFHFKVTDPFRDLINPAVNGTLSLLKSAQQHGNRVKTVVITSSVAAVSGGSPKPGYIFTESDWNDQSLKEIQADPVNFNPGTAYRASKASAERAAWKFVEDNKPSFTLTTINPSFVFGPAIHPIDDVASLNTSVGLLFDYFANSSAKAIPRPLPLQLYVDVRDVAKAHVSAFVTPEASGKRFLLASRPFAWQEVVDIIKKQYPERPSAYSGPGAGIYDVDCGVDNSQSRKILGIDYITLEKTTVDTIESLKRFWPSPKTEAANVPQR